MGFAVAPPCHKPGVYYFVELDHFVIVQSTMWPIGCDIWYKKGQRRTRFAKYSIFNEMIYIGEFE